jgi:hypothetical protein
MLGEKICRTPNAVRIEIRPVGSGRRERIPSHQQSTVLQKLGKTVNAAEKRLSQAPLPNPTPGKLLKDSTGLDRSDIHRARLDQARTVLRH